MLLTYSGPVESLSMVENQSGIKHYLALSRPVAALVNAGDLRKNIARQLETKLQVYDLQDSQLELHTNL